MAVQLRALVEVISAAQQSFDLYNEDLGASGPCGPGLGY